MEYSDNEDIDNEFIEPEDLFFSDEEAEEDNKTYLNEKFEEKLPNEKDVVKSKKISQRKPSKRVKLNFERISGPNGLKALKKSIMNFKFKGENHEKEDLTKLIKLLQHWLCNGLFLNGNFEGLLEELEILGSKKNVQTYMKKIRMGIDEWGENTSGNQEDSEGLEDKDDTTYNNEQSASNFESWWQEQLALVPSSDDDVLSLIEGTHDHSDINSTNTGQSQSQHDVILTSEQLERIAANKQKALERKMKLLENKSTL